MFRFQQKVTRPAEKQVRVTAAQKRLVIVTDFEGADSGLEDTQSRPTKGSGGGYILAGLTKY